jgi:hypothetical protein
MAPVAPYRNDREFGCSTAVTIATSGLWSIGGVSLAAQNVVVGPVSSARFPDVVGLLGADVLSRFKAMRLDYDSGMLILAGSESSPDAFVTDGRLSTPTLPAALTAGTYHHAPLQVSAMTSSDPDGTVIIREVQALAPVEVVGRQRHFLIDTGGIASSVNSSAIASAGLVPTHIHVPASEGLACSVILPIFTIRSWRLDDVPLSEQAVAVQPPPPTWDGTLGSGTLQQFSPIVIDFREGVLLFGAEHGPSPKVPGP